MLVPTQNLATPATNHFLYECDGRNDETTAMQAPFTGMPAGGSVPPRRKGSMTMLMTGLSGNEIYCLAQKGYSAGKHRGRQQRLLARVRAGDHERPQDALGRRDRQHHPAHRRRPPRRHQPARTGSEGRRGSRTDRRRVGSAEAQQPDGVHRDRIVGEERGRLRARFSRRPAPAKTSIARSTRATSPGIS